MLKRASVLLLSLLAATLHTAVAADTLSGAVSDSPYANLQEAWDNCYAMKATCADLMDEGRYAPARKKWVQYDASLLTQNVAAIRAAMGPATMVVSMEASLQKLQTAADNMKSPTDDKYPTAFWGATRELMSESADLDKNLVEALGKLDQTMAAQNTSSASSLQGRVTFTGKNTDVESLVNASNKITDVTQHMAAELDRFNMGWGKAPTQPLQNEFYQGAFTKQEILSQYKYMPNFVFTTDPSVARFTYRLPPRKNVLGMYANQIGKLLNLMDGDMLALQAAVQAKNDQAVNAPWQALKAKYDDARTQYLALYNLLQTTDDKKLAEDIRGDQGTYGKPMIALRDDMDQFRSAMNDFIAIGR